MKKLTIITGVLEAATGLALLVAPWLVGRWLLGTELVGVSVVVARVAGIALLALGIACWSGTPLCGMLSYSTLATAYLAWLAIGGVWPGPCCGRWWDSMRSLPSCWAGSGLVTYGPNGLAKNEAARAEMAFSNTLAAHYLAR